MYKINKMDKDANLALPNGKSYKLNVIEGSIGGPAIDIKELYGETGFLTYDPAFMSTASCESKITYIDGEKGVLLYRGYRIEDLANGRFDFLEIAYLLLYGELPRKEEFSNFQSNINSHSSIHERLYKALDAFEPDGSPMDMIAAMFSSLSSLYENSDKNVEKNLFLVTHMAIAKITTMVAATYRYSIGQNYIAPKSNLDYTANFLNMMFSRESENYEVNKIFRDALNIILILHADHEQNASTSTVRGVGSTGANPFACLASGVNALSGPLHGGANEAVISMLRKIGDVKNIPSFIGSVKNKKATLMGFGHRVYKNFDPRANILREQSAKVLSLLDKNDSKNKELVELLNIAQELEKIALNDEYFISRKLYPNVDFYSGIILTAMEIPSKMFTTLFALARTTGWIAQYNEMISSKSKIFRPRQIYTGEKEREINFVELEEERKSNQNGSISF